MALSTSDLPMMYSLLSNSLSGDVSVREPAISALSQSEGRPGFCSCLMEVITAKDLVAQVDIRLMASVYFKNSVNRHWGKRRIAGISNEEKTHLRQKLLSHLGEENYQIAQQLAVLVSKIARVDYPKEWPELFSVLSQQLHSADIRTSHKIFIVMFRSLKELSTKRLSSDQRTFAEISSHLFDFSWHLWQSDIQTILRDFSALAQSLTLKPPVEHQEKLSLTCQRWLLCSKVLRLLVIFGFQSDKVTVQDIRPVKEVCPILLNAIQSFLPYYSCFREVYPEFGHFTKKICIKLMQILVAVQSRHPYSFGDKCVLAPVMDFCLNRITNPEPELLSFEHFLIQCMVMVKSILECKEYKPSITGRVMNEARVTLEQMKKNVSSVVSEILASLLSTERVVLLCNILIRRYFVFTASDLDEWFKSPESFHHEQDMVQWAEKLRPCAEALYIVLFQNNSQLLVPVVISILQEAMTGCPPSETAITPGMLLKDAAYSAAGHVYYELSDKLNFKDWFNGALSLELANGHTNLRIIHRKVALILGQWVSEGPIGLGSHRSKTRGTRIGEVICAREKPCVLGFEIKDDTKRPVYCALIRLLQDKDLAVRLAACRSLVCLIEDANFSQQDFSDLLPTCWDLCFKLVEEVEEFDSKVQVLNLISVLINQVNVIVPYAQRLVEFFQKWNGGITEWYQSRGRPVQGVKIVKPRVWEESSGESLLRIQLLEALRSFVNKLGFQSPICYNMLLPILQMGIDINGPDELNLLEDSVLLWEVTLSNAPSLVPQLLGFFPCLVDIMERSFEHLQVAINIIEGYIVLGGNEFLNMHASNVAKLLDAIIGSVNDRGLNSTLPVVEILIQCFPMEAPPLICSVLQKLIVICLSGGDDCDPAKTAVKASSATILARVLVTNTNYFAHLTSDQSLSLALQQAGVSASENVLLRLVDVWLEKVDTAKPIQKKTYGLALAIILTLRVPQVLDILDDILSVCTSVLLSETEEPPEDEFRGDSMNSSGSHCEDTSRTKEFRKRQIQASDPIKRASLETTVRDNLQVCATLHGESSFNAAISRMHPAALSQLQQALKMASVG
ncbi:hypothetical protein GIB67_014314 [Kingdonia uniflora]|uniref:Importin N-terminal domain-containing protein n=1 Tax=Kingdonia uniflora TaxID=39325 RepID=A0A7J7NTT4_9MAGN|nr:hypothetical protein GIB67_014314 [Kingdonia uniflora]